MVAAQGQRRKGDTTEVIERYWGTCSCVLPSRLSKGLQVVKEKSEGDCWLERRISRHINDLAPDQLFVPCLMHESLMSPLVYCPSS